MSQNARIVGKVEVRQGDGATQVIRRGPVDVDTTAADATLSWTEGETHAAVAMPLTDFNRYLTQGAIELDPKADAQMDA